MRTCPTCGHENLDDARFCSQCATRLEPGPGAGREERKVVTCLFCDLVGFTARAEGMDPEDVRRLLQPYHSRVRGELERFGGTVEKFIGDAVMAVFGAPVAHEDDPERAVRAALSIRDSLAEDGELDLRIGVTTGEALITLDARPETGEGMASGDVVNTAARLQAAAPTGGILVDETTYRATQGVVEYTTADAVQAKGKALPVPVWEALRAELPLGAERLGAAPLVGRQRELDVLRAAVRRAFDERQPSLVTLVGVPGIGKSRLVRELHALAQDGIFGSVTWLRGRSLPYGEDLGFWAFREMIKAHAGVLETDSRAVARGKLSTTVARFSADESESDWVERHLSPLLGGAEGHEGEDRRAERFAAWRRFVEWLAAAQPLLLVFEDLHWADDGLLDFVGALGDSLGDLSIVVLATARPELLERRPGWGASARETLLRLEPLSDDATSELIEQLLAIAALPPETRSALLEQAAGNPLYAEQYVRMVAERGLGQAVPETVQALIVARLDGLPDAEKSVARDASVTGSVFWSGSVAAAVGQDRWVVEEHLRALERKAFVRRSRDSSVAGETEWTFAHALVRDAAYSAIPRALRSERHVRVAAWIESLGGEDDHAELLAFHYSSALELARAVGLDSPEISDSALRAVRRAGERAFALHAFGAAARFYRRALDLVAADDPQRPRLLLELGRGLYLSEAAGEDELLAAREALLRTDDYEGLAEAETLLAELYRSAGRRERFQTHAAAAGALAANLEPSAVKTRVLLVVAAEVAGRGEYEEALGIARKALALAEELGLEELRARCLNTIGWTALELGDDTGLGLLEQSVELGRTLGSPEAIRSCTNLSHQLRHRGEFRRSVELTEEAVRLAGRFGDAPQRRWQLAVLSQLRYRQGRWDEALEAIESYLEEVQSSHLQAWLVLGTRGLIRLSRGDEAGLEDSATSIDAARRSVERSVLPATLEMRARSLVLAGAREEAAQPLDEALAIFETGTGWAGFDLPLLAVTTVELGLDGGRVLAIARPSRWAEAARLYLAGDFGRAADVYEEIGSVTDEAEARLRSGRALLDAGRRTEGEVELGRALAFYRSVGASCFVRQGEALLAGEGDSSLAPTGSP